MSERELQKTLFKHMMYCQEQREKAEKENAKYNGFFSQQYEAVQKCKEQGLDFLQYASLKRKAKADWEFWDREFDFAVKEFYASFNNEVEAVMHMIVCC